MKERQTLQLAAIYHVVSHAHDHPTAEEICARVRRTMPRISLGTVYRNLQKLVLQQRVRIVHVTDRVARYDRTVGEHDHFVCEQCGRLADLAHVPGGRPDCRGLRRAGYRVREHALTFYGLCPDCARRESRRAAPIPSKRAQATP